MIYYPPLGKIEREVFYIISYATDTFKKTPYFKVFKKIINFLCYEDIFNIP
jgi:hypothetical protein